MAHRPFISFAMALSCLLACPSSGEGEPKADTGEALPAKQAKAPKGPTSPLDAVEEVVAGIKKRKPERVRAALSPEATWRVAGGEPAKGPDAILAALDARNSALRLRLNATDYFVVGNDVVLSGSWIGVHVDEFAGVAPTKDGVGVEGAALFRTDGTRVTEVVEYFDVSSPYAQIGAIPAGKVWAQRDDLSVVVGSDPKIHDAAGDEAAVTKLEELHAGLTEAEPPALPPESSGGFAYWESATASAISGDDIAAHFVDLRTAFPDLNITVEEKWVVEDAVLARTRWKGTQAGKLGPWPAKQGKLDLECLEVVRMDGATPTSWTVHFNGYAALRAMGVIDALPG